MSIKYTNAKYGIFSTLQFYFRNDIKRWDSDNTAEIDYIVACIESMIEEKIKEAFKNGLG